MTENASTTETIAAISTPPGRGGIGIVRLAGPLALEIAARLVLLRVPLEHARATFARVVDPAESEEQNTGVSPLRRKERAFGRDDEEVRARGRDDKEVVARGRDDGEVRALGRDDGEVGAFGRGDSVVAAVGRAGNEVATIDDAIVTAFFAPHSYTGDDLVEIAAHGSPVVLEAILQAALADPGVRLAAPGEFTQRAFLSGRLDLTQAEAVQDLIAAQTLDQARVAAQQMGGALSRRVAPAKEALLHVIALLEAGMDFASGELDDVDVVSPAEITLYIERAAKPLDALAASFRRGQLLRQGAAIALAGRPNAGKSSLFNRLLERERAIVTPLPGTTRDTVEESLALGGIPLRLIDTAGLRYGDAGQIDEAEQKGIARSHEALADADLVLFLHDATQPLTSAERDLIASLEARPHLLVWNKVDLVGGAAGAEALSVATMNDGLKPTSNPGLEASFSSPFAAENNRALARESDAIHTSALTGEGLDDLRSAILRELRAEGALGDAGALNNLRQQQAVTAALTALATAAAANAAGLPHELLLLDLHSALRSLDELTGTTTTDDILGRIFSTFCIGK